jgi:hypothetical protein
MVASAADKAPNADFQQQRGNEYRRQPKHGGRKQKGLEEPHFNALLQVRCWNSPANSILLEFVLGRRSDD